MEDVANIQIESIDTEIIKNDKIKNLSSSMQIIEDHEIVRYDTSIKNSRNYIHIVLLFHCNVSTKLYISLFFFSSFFLDLFNILK